MKILIQTLKNAGYLLLSGLAMLSLVLLMGWMMSVFPVAAFIVLLLMFVLVLGYLMALGG